MGPRTPPVPTTLACDPMPLPRSSAGNTEVIIAIPVPCVIAAPSPCNAFAPIRATMLPEVAANTAAATKMTRPERNIRLRPTMSDSLPIGSKSALIVKPSAMTTHCTVDRSASKYCAMVGSATDMPPWFTTEVNVPSATAANTHQR